MVIRQCAIDYASALQLAASPQLRCVIFDSNPRNELEVNENMCETYETEREEEERQRERESEVDEKGRVVKAGFINLKRGEKFSFWSM